MADYQQITDKNFLPAEGKKRIPVYFDKFNNLVTGTNKIAADTIEEKTSGNGVAIDSVTLKDGQLLPDDGTVTQATSITTGVTLNKPAGVITTQSASAAADAAHTFTVTNSFVATDSVILANICDYAGTIATNGNPNVIVDNITAGTFDIIITNTHGTNALSGALKIAFTIL